MTFRCQYPYTVIVLRVPTPIPPGSELWELYDDTCDVLDSMGSVLAIEVRHVESHLPFVASARFGRQDGEFVCVKNQVEQLYIGLGIEDFLCDLAETIEQEHLGSISSPCQ